MNHTIRTMERRRSIRKFKPDMPERTDLQLIVEAGLYAPSGMNRQAAVTITITNKAVRDALAEANRKIGGWPEGFDPFYGAPAVLIVLSDKESYNHVYDGALAMGNIMLAAHALGLGSCWINRAKQEFESEEGKEILRALGIEGDWEGIGHCALGYAAAPLPAGAPRKPGRVVWA